MPRTWMLSLAALAIAVGGSPVLSAQVRCVGFRSVSYAPSGSVTLLMTHPAGGALTVIGLSEHPRTTARTLTAGAGNCVRLGSQGQVAVLLSLAQGPGGETFRLYLAPRLTVGGVRLAATTALHQRARDGARGLSISPFTATVAVASGFRLGLGATLKAEQHERLRAAMGPLAALPVGGGVVKAALLADTRFEALEMRLVFSRF